MEEDQFENHCRLPTTIRIIMNWLCTTRFYKKTYEERKKYYEEEPEKIKDWMFCDFVVDAGTLEEPLAIRIGEIPRYQGDHEKTIYIDFRHKENCFLRRGYATGLYASRVIANKYEIPNYMKEELEFLIDLYNQRRKG